MVTKSFVDVWKLRSKLSKPSKNPWTIFNRCSLNSSRTGITMIPGVTMMRKNIIAMNQPKTEKSKESSSMDAEVLKGIQAQIASLTQRDELKKVRTVHSYPLEWDSVPYPPKFKPPTLHTYDGKSSPNQLIYYFQS